MRDYLICNSIFVKSFIHRGVVICCFAITKTLPFLSIIKKAKITSVASMVNAKVYIYNKLKQQLNERSRINYGNCLIFRMAVSKLSEFLIWNQWKDKMKWI